MRMSIEEYNAYMLKKSGSKYGNVKTEYNGETYDSKKEAKRAEALNLLVRAGKVKDLQRQMSIPFFVNGIKVFNYKADFTYFDCEKNKVIIEDVKSDFTRKDRVYRLKKKCLEAQGYQIVEYI